MGAFVLDNVIANYDFGNKAPKIHKHSGVCLYEKEPTTGLTDFFKLGQSDGFSPRADQGKTTSGSEKSSWTSSSSVTQLRSFELRASDVIAVVTLDEVEYPLYPQDLISYGRAIYAELQDLEDQYESKPSEALAKTISKKKRYLDQLAELSEDMVNCKHIDKICLIDGIIPSIIESSRSRPNLSARGDETVVFGRVSPDSLSSQLSEKARIKILKDIARYKLSKT